MRSEGKGSPRQGSFQAERPLALSDRTKVYLEENADNSVRDAASMARTFGESGQSRGIYESDSSYKDTILEQLSSGSKLQQQVGLEYGAAGNDKLDPNESQSLDGTATQFDIDVPVAYGSAAVGSGVNSMDVAEVGSSAIGASIVLLANEDEAIDITLQSSEVMDRINKERVPCPRLCGGSFSSGIGGIVCFQNGEVRKMWSWYEQSDPKRRIQASGYKGRRSSSEFISSPDLTSKDKANREDTTSVFLTNTSEQDGPPSRQECPRTFQDLEDMTQHARMAQWRSDESSGGESSVDDQSDESVDESASDDDDGGDTEISRKRMYERYFGSSQVKKSASPPRQDSKENTEGIVSPRSPSRQKTNVKFPVSAAEAAFVGPSSDLVPIVYIAHKHDALVLNGQCTELALGWLLGDWYTMSDEIEDASCKELDGKEKSERDGGGWNDEEGTLQAWPLAGEFRIGPFHHFRLACILQSNICLRFR